MSVTDEVGLERIGLAEKIGYALGDTASNLVFQILAIFALTYYTDTVGISPAIVGVLFLVVRFIDAFTDPLMGRIADSTQTRMGRYRPWLLWLAVPFGVAGVLAFSVPEASATIEIGYMFVTYVLITLVYTAINIPYSALVSSMTADPVERQQIQSWRFVGGQLGALSIGMFTMPLVEQLGGGAEGWRNTLIVFGVAAIVMFLICFAVTRERIGAVQPNEEAQQNVLWDDLKSLWRNDQWRILCAINFVLLTALIMRVQTVSYFIRDAMAIPDNLLEGHISAYFTLGGVAAISASFIPNVVSEKLTLRKLSLPFLSQVLLTTLTIMIGVVPLELGLYGCAAVVPAIIASVAMGRLFGRTRFLTLMFAAQVVGSLALYVVGASSFVGSALVFALINFFNQVAVPILWTLMADAVDYGEAKTGHRLPALVFSTVLFALKAGIALAGFLGGVLLSVYGYQAPVASDDVIVQSSETINGIVMIFALFPAFVTAILVFLAMQVRLTEPFMRQIRVQLSANPEKGATHA